MKEKNNPGLYAFWRKHSNAPFHFPMDETIWVNSMYFDTDSDGRELFAELKTNVTRTAPNKSGDFTGLIQYGRTAFGFDNSGDISYDIHYPVIRFLCFDPDFPKDGQQLLDWALEDLGSEARIYAFFHYFGLSVCARHGKLHGSDPHVEQLLLQNGFTVEHENVYYSKVLQESDTASEKPTLVWRDLSPGGCREFTAIEGGKEVGWGQIHFLPQGDTAYLRWIYIDEQNQHQGFGTAIMRNLFSELYRMGIRRFDTDTALSNTIAQRYYEKNGFVNEGITRSYYTKS